MWEFERAERVGGVGEFQVGDGVYRMGILPSVNGNCRSSLSFHSVWTVNDVKILSSLKSKVVGDHPRRTN